MEAIAEAGAAVLFLACFGTACVLLLWQWRTWPPAPSTTEEPWGPPPTRWDPREAGPPGVGYTRLARRKVKVLPERAP